MKKVEAIIRDEKLSAAKEALKALGDSRNDCYRGQRSWYSEGYY